ncbi:MAG: aminotransferase class III-fold pyridoxal phosphate-dependent enzyme [Methylacidiphilales bacterium]|nr:aminotransferase class III-fold pyridoxal phosphate-dependent enzyme [Candidatus Methylacidiphilales bacterium]
MNERRLLVAPPSEVIQALGSKIQVKDGSWLYDCTSSWWCKSFGHQHPKLQSALISQAQQFEQVIFAHCTYSAIDQLSERLSNSCMEGEAKVFYTSEGSSAIEMALKLVEHTWCDQNGDQVGIFVGLQNGYHGETIGALSVSDSKIYKAPYQKLCFDTTFLTVPYISQGSVFEIEHCDCRELELALEKLPNSIKAFILEPFVQGASGMLMYHADVIRTIFAYTQKNKIPLIVDEIMTGMGRLGAISPCKIAGIKPDIICLSKGLTAGWVPFSATIIQNRFYHRYLDHPYAKSFLHSHTYCGNPLGANVALAVLDLLKEIDYQSLFYSLQTVATSVTQTFDYFSKARSCGAIVAWEVIARLRNHDIFPAEVTSLARKHGLLLRPIGNTIYLLPPLTTTHEELQQIGNRLHDLAVDLPQLFL